MQLRFGTAPRAPFGGRCRRQVSPPPTSLLLASLGAAYVAGLAVGFWDSQDELRQNWGVDHIWQPQMDEAERAHLYACWKRAVERTFNWLD